VLVQLSLAVTQLYFLGQSYRQICINMHTWRGIGILVIFAAIGEKENFPTPLLPPTLCARDAETHIRRTRAAAADS